MRLYLFFLSLILFSVSNPLYATNRIENDSLPKEKKHSPKLALGLSAVCPGAGQIYNKKYWKLPIVYGGIGVCLKMWNDSRVLEKEFEDVFIDRTNNIQTDKYQNDYSDENILNVRNLHRRNKEFYFVIGSLLYVLNIVDAVVDAHLFNFDVSDDLSMQLTPCLITDYSSCRSATGVKLSFTINK